MLKMNRLCAFVLLSAFCAVPCFAETFEEVEKKIRDAVKKTKSFKADIKSEMQMKMEGFEMRSLMVGKMESVLDGELYKMYSEAASDSTQKVAGVERKTKQNMIGISDGKFLYTVVEEDGKKQATKTKAPSRADSEVPWAVFRKNGDFKVLPDEKIDGQDCYVIEMKMKTPPVGGGLKRTVFYCRKDCGAQIKVVGYASDDKVMMTTTYTNVEINKDIPASRFVFKAPEGVTVVDRTGA
ncbi:MAG: hypothetical protein GXP29_04050 [Planctomycetes bacterium]|nr:hypothetical protein [Planctomycetota bacterium]